MSLPRVAVAACVVALIVACTDMATDPPLEPGTPTLGESALEGFSLSGAPSTATAYRCFTSVADPDGPFAYRYGRMELPAPPGLRQSEDDLIRLTYRLWTEGGELVRLANCWIPRSRAAVEWTAAWFKAAEGDRNIRWSGPFSAPDSGIEADGAVGTASTDADTERDCVRDNTFEDPCPIEGVIVDPGDDDDGSDPWDPGGGDDGGDDPCHHCWDEGGGGGGDGDFGGNDGCTSGDGEGAGDDEEAGGVECDCGDERDTIIPEYSNSAYYTGTWRPTCDSFASSGGTTPCTPTGGEGENMTMNMIRPTIILAVSILLAAALHAPVSAQTSQAEEAIARQLLMDDREEKMEALLRLQRLGTEPSTPVLRDALIETLEAENALCRQRRQAMQRGAQVEPLMDDVYGSTAQAVVAMGDPAAISALAGAVGSGLMVIRALVDFGEPAARAVLEVIDSPGASPQGQSGAIIALRMMVENEATRPLTGETRKRLRQTALRHLRGKQPGIVLRQAIDLAVVLNDPELMQIVASLASHRDEVIARGITDPDLITRTQKHAAERLAGVPPLPRR